MEVIRNIPDMHATAVRLRKAGSRIGVVPTMGYLHEGHLSLIRIAKQHADVVITTLFVNPAQFAPGEDFSRYPRDLDRDTRLASQAGTDVLFAPETSDVYPEDFLTHVEVERISKVMEGRTRPTHFKGVTTIVSKLFNITTPHVAVFGQKDAQQAAVIKRMVKDLDFDIEIVIGPIVREPDGLAMSSRNIYMSSQERRDATILFQSLKLAQDLIHGGERDSQAIVRRMHELISGKPTAQVEYISVADAAGLNELSQIQPGDHVLISLAVRVGTTRLIDNILAIIP